MEDLCLCIVLGAILWKLSQNTVKFWVTYNSDTSLPSFPNEHKTKAELKYTEMKQVVALKMLKPYQS